MWKRQSLEMSVPRRGIAGIRAAELEAAALWATLELLVHSPAGEPGLEARTRQATRYFRRAWVCVVARASKLGSRLVEGIGARLPRRAGTTPKFAQPIKSKRHLCIFLFDSFFLTVSLPTTCRTKCMRGGVRNVTQPDAIVHLKRAYDVLKDVESKTENLRKRAASHDASFDTNAPFLQTMWTGFVGTRRLGAEKAELVQDLELATSEMEKATSLDPGVTIETKDGTFDPTNTRAVIWLLYGQIEMVWGTLQKARQNLEYSLQLFESPETLFMLGAVCESQYDAPSALRYFEKYLELDPNGEYSVGALRAVNQLRNYRKRFRGDWTLLILSLVVCFPVAIVYFITKYK